jgi:hypothetical protein
MLHVRFPLPLRTLENLLDEQAVEIRHETARPFTQPRAAVLAERRGPCAA